MKPIARVTLRCTLLLVLLFLLASPAAFADTVLVGSLDLINIIPGPGGLDSFFLSNLTGAGGLNIPTDSLTLSNIQLSINGGAAISLADLTAGGTDFLENLVQDSITSFSLTASLGSSPLTVNVNGLPVEILSAISVFYSGSALDTSSGSPHFDVFATPANAVPEPGSLTLFGTAIGSAGWFLRFRRSKS